MQLLEQIMGSLGGDAKRQMGQILGADERQTGQAAGAALTAILGALQRNASNPDGAAALDRALEKDHDGSVLDDVGGLLGKASQGPGDAILGHVFGNRRQQVERNVGRASGMDPSQVASLMTMLAPIVMGALGKQKRQSGMDVSALSGFLGQEAQAMERPEAGGGGLLGALLDTDGDGDFDAADAIKRGSGLLGKLFGGR